MGNTPLLIDQLKILQIEGISESLFIFNNIVSMSYISFALDDLIEEIIVSIFECVTFLNVRMGAFMFTGTAVQLR